MLTGEIFVRITLFNVNAGLTILSLQPLGIRAKGMSLSVASNWLWNFGIGYATPYLVDQTTGGVDGVKAANLGVKVFFIWGGTCVGCLIFTCVLLSFTFYLFIPFRALPRVLVVRKCTRR